MGDKGEGIVDIANIDVKKMFGNPIIKQCDMSDEMKAEVIDAAQNAVDTKPNAETAARTIKEFMDKKYGQSWHCIIGSGFGYEITCQQKHLLIMYFQGLCILLYKQ